MATLTINVPDKLAEKFSHTKAISIPTLYREYRNLHIAPQGGDEECFDEAVQSEMVRSKFSLLASKL